MSGIDSRVLHPFYISMGLPWLTVVGSFWPIALILALTYHRLPALPISHRMRGSIEINASVGKVWSVVQPKDRDTYWGAAFSHIRAAEDDPNHLMYFFDAALGFADRPPEHYYLEAMVPREYFRIANVREDGSPRPGRRRDYTEMWLKETEDGTSVICQETWSGIPLDWVPMFMFANAVQDSLFRLKAKVEGSPDRSQVSQMRERQLEDHQSKIDEPNGSGFASFSDLMLFLSVAAAFLFCVVWFFGVGDLTG